MTFDRYWYNQINIFAPLLEASESTFVFDSLSDDTVTIFHGAGFTYTDGVPTGGRITSIDWVHRDGSGDRLIQSASQFQSVGANEVSYFAGPLLDLRTQIGWIGLIDQAALPLTPPNLADFVVANTDGTSTKIYYSYNTSSAVQSPITRIERSLPMDRRS